MGLTLNVRAIALLATIEMDNYEMLDKAWDDLSPEEQKKLLDLSEASLKPLILDGQGEPDFGAMFERNQELHNRSYGGHQDSNWSAAKVGYIEGATEIWESCNVPSLLKEVMRMRFVMAKLKAILNKD